MLDRHALLADRHASPVVTRPSPDDRAPRQGGAASVRLASSRKATRPPSAEHTPNRSRCDDSCPPTTRETSGAPRTDPRATRRSPGRATRRPRARAATNRTVDTAARGWHGRGTLRRRRIRDVPTDAVRATVMLRPPIAGIAAHAMWHEACLRGEAGKEVPTMYSILYIIGAIVVIIVVLRLLGLY